jgi:2-oxoglutarate ferredoxin oxidoreductase subunit delta
MLPKAISPISIMIFKRLLTDISHTLFSFPSRSLLLKLLAKFSVMNENQTPIVPPKQRKVKGIVQINVQRCKGCELCTVECKEHALSLGEAINIKGYRYVVANNDLCTGCVNCALVCPDAVITVYRTNVKKKKQAAEAILNESIGEAILESI